MKKIKVAKWPSGTDAWVEKRIIDKGKCPSCDEEWNGEPSQYGHSPCCGDPYCGRPQEFYLAKKGVKAFKFE